ncbi:MAG: glucosyltransferase domain-containing protein [Chromatiaceae bacterium]|nr:glucosyltransferase domain-containing protein [Chromatiaceae bacterium]
MRDYLQSLFSRFHLLLLRIPLDDPSGATTKAFQLAFMVALMAFGFELTNPTLGVDDYTHLHKADVWDQWWVARGMWGALVVQYLTPGHWITPFISLLVGICIQLFTAVALGWLLGYPRDRVAPLFFLYSIWTLFPYFAAQMAFSYLQVAYPLASLSVVLGLLLAMTGGRNRLRLVLGSVSIAFGISVYQGSLSVLGPVAVLAPAAAYFGQRKRGGRAAIPALELAARVLLAVMLGAALYYGVHKILVYVLDAKPTSAFYSVSFDFAFWRRWGAIRDDIEFLTLGAGSVLPPLTVVAWMLVLLGSGIVLAREKGGMTAIAVAAVALTTATVSVFGVLFLHSGQLAPRSTVGLGVVWAVAFSAGLLMDARFLHKVVISTALFVLATFVFHINAMFFSQYLVQEADKLMIARILERVEALYGESDYEGTKTVVPIGGYTHASSPHQQRYAGSVIGFSNFEWDGGNPWRIAFLAASLGSKGYKWEDAGQARDSLDLDARKPWPSTDAVFLHEGKAIVWLGEAQAVERTSPIQSWFRNL